MQQGNLEQYAISLSIPASGRSAWTWTAQHSSSNIHIHKPLRVWNTKRVPDMVNEPQITQERSYKSHAHASKSQGALQ